MRGSETMNKYDKGYISLYRKFKNWRYYTNDNIKSVFIHCLLSACWEDTVIGEYNGKPIKPIVLKRGSFITSRKKLCAELGKTDKQIRYALEKLSRANDRANDRAKEITVNGANQYTIISVDNFEDFQFLFDDKGQVKNDVMDQDKGHDLGPHINKDINKDIIDKIDKIDKSDKSQFKNHNSLTVKLLESGFITEGDIPETYDALFEEYLESNSYAHLFVILDYILKRAHPSRIKNKYSYLKKSINSNLKKMELLKKKNVKGEVDLDHELAKLFEQLKKEEKL